MKKLTLACLLAALAALFGAFSAPARAVPSGLPPPVAPQGFGVNVHWDRMPSAAELALFSQAGFGFVRMDIVETDVEKAPGVYDFAEHDAVMNLLAARHCRSLIMLYYASPLYDNNYAPHTAARRADFARFAAAAAARYRGRGVVWEIWNEPNAPFFWKPTPNADDLALAAIAAARAMRKADPDACIVAPGSAGEPLDYLKTVFQHGLLRDIDGVSVHPYRPSNPETVGADYLGLRELIASCTPAGEPQRPIVCSEWGYSLTSPWHGITEDLQGRYIVREWLANLAYGVNLTAYYDWHDDAARDPADSEAHFGTVHHDFSPKPAFTAAKALIHDLDGYRFVHKLQTSSPSDWSMLFRKGDSLAVVSWTTDTQAAPEAQSPQVRFVAPADPDYRELREAAWVEYGSAPLMATAYAPVQLPVTVTDPDTTPTAVTVTVGAARRVLHLTSGEQKTILFTLTGADVAPGQSAPEPVLVTWNGARVDALPPVTLATAPLVHLTVKPSPTAFVIQTDSLGMPVKGRLEIDAGNKATFAPLSLGAFGSASLSEKLDSSQEIHIIAWDDHHHMLAETQPSHYLPLTPFPQAASGPSDFNVLPFLNNIPGAPAPPQVVAAGSGAPEQTALSIPYPITKKWVFTELTPKTKLMIPAGARSLRLWIHANNTGVPLNARFVDSTGQTFQPSVTTLNWNGWQAVTIPFSGEIPSWGGAWDHIPHLPLHWDCLVMVDGSHLPEAEATDQILVSSPYYEMP